MRKTEKGVQLWIFTPYSWRFQPLFDTIDRSVLKPSQDEFMLLKKYTILYIILLIFLN